jgi:hypothetical protein
MSKLRFLAVAVLIGCIIILAGCGAGNRSDSTVAKEVADTFANVGNGFTQEANDNMALFLASSAISSSGLSGSVLHSSAVSYTMVLNLVDAHWSWDSTNHIYSYSNTIYISIPPNITGQINPYEVTIMLGTGSTASSNLIPTNIHSFTYHRNITGYLDNSALGTHRTGTVTTDLVFTGLNDSTAGVTINGTRTANWTVTGTWSSMGVITFAFTNVTAQYSLIDGGYKVVYIGDVAVNYNGSITGPRGTRTVNASGVIHMNGQKTVQVTIDGSTVTVDVTTGAISSY